MNIITKTRGKLEMSLLQSKSLKTSVNFHHNILTSQVHEFKILFTVDLFKLRNIQLWYKHIVHAMLVKSF